MNKSLLVACAAIIFIIGVGTGYFLTPEYSYDQTMAKSAMKPLGKADRFLDKRYLEGVISHHLSAIDMAKQALANSKRPEILDLSKAIIELDTKAIESLNKYRLDWYKDSRPITQFNKTNLGTADDNFDLRYLNALIAHHLEAIETAKEVKGKSVRNEVLNLSDDINQFLSNSLVTLKKWREDWYKVK